MYYSGRAEYQNRTANSVQIRVHWSTSIVANHYNGYGQAVYVYYGDRDIPPYLHLRVGSWPEKGSEVDRSASSVSNWIEIPLNTTGATVVDLGIYLYQCTNNVNDDLTVSKGYDGAHTTLPVKIPAF